MKNKLSSKLRLTTVNLFGLYSKISVVNQSQMCYKSNTIFLKKRKNNRLSILRIKNLKKKKFSYTKKKKYVTSQNL